MADKSKTLADYIAKLNAGQPLSDEEFDAAWKSGQGGNLSAQEQQNFLAAYNKYAQSTPDGKLQIQQKLRDTATQSFTKKYKPFFDASLAGADFVTSISQIRNSNSALKKLIQPGIPTPSGLPPELKGQIYKAQMGGFQASRALSPAKQAIAQQFNNQVANARNMSGGNIGSYTAQYNAASQAAQRASASLPAIDDAIRARYDERGDKLILGEGQLGMENDRNRLGAAQLAMEQYNQNAIAAGALGQAGRLNLRQTAGQLPSLLPSMMGQYGYPQQPQTQPQAQQNSAPPIDHGQVLGDVIKASTGGPSFDGMDWADGNDPSTYAQKLMWNNINHARANSPTYFPDQKY